MQTQPDLPALNVSYRRVGGLRFLKIGRLTLSWSIATAYKPVKSAAATSRALAGA